MMRSRLAATLLCLTAVACGGSGEPSTQPSSPAATTSAAPAPMSKEAYVTAVNAVCKDVLAQAEAIEEPTDARGYVEATKSYITMLEAGQARLRALEPPAADAAKADEFVAANEEQIELLRTMLPRIEAAAAKDDKDAVEAEFAGTFEQFNEIATKQAKWATEYGLTECV